MQVHPSFCWHFPSPPGNGMSKGNSPPAARTSVVLPVMSYLASLVPWLPNYRLSSVGCSLVQLPALRALSGICELYLQRLDWDGGREEREEGPAGCCKFWETKITMLHTVFRIIHEHTCKHILTHTYAWQPCIHYYYHHQHDYYTPVYSTASSVHKLKQSKD